MAEQLRIFEDRAAAGRELARAVGSLRLARPLIVLGLPRGGVPVAYEVARALCAPLDVLVVRKVGMPGQPELAIGAIAAGGVVVREPVLSRFANLDLEFDALARREHAELQRRERAYRGGLAPLDLNGTTAVLVDDGLATGATMIAAVQAARQAGAASVIVAAPVASTEAAARIAEVADQLVVLETPPAFWAIGEWYVDFEQLEDAQVRALLERARQEALETKARSRGAA
ncbi:MAG TPA: phosphoribosyltransferase family protein [Steroidobacteraceae bacterium]|jgi:predicted phosphoribosyltransferase